MLLNRVLQVKMVKPKKATTDTDKTNENLNEGVATIVATTTEKVVRKLAMAALGYVVLDTARQVMVAHATNQ